MMDSSVQIEKIHQALAILKEKDVDVWLTFVRETSHNADPALPLISPADVTWHSAFILTKTGRKVVIVGRYEVENFKRMNVWDEVIGYDKSIQPALLEVLEKIAPRQIAVNYSESDTAADGLSHGMYLTLQRYFAGKGWELISAEGVLNALRGRKTAAEIARIRAAVAMTDEIVDQITEFLRPGLSEQQIYEFVHNEYKQRGVIASWDAAYCPTVTVGPESPVGHVSASEHYVTQAGHLVRIDQGVVLNDYISDIQRVWYLQPAGESAVPQPVRHAFESVRAAIEAARAVLKPGVEGWVVDDAARTTITAAGYPEYQHAVGHGIGRTVHDGATLLGPKWERYGQTPYGVVEVGNCFTLELGVSVAGYGLVSLEEDVVVTETGAEYLHEPQRDLIIVPC
ncbi:MAG TPA: M24 family metallopeptidase [Aggregatilineales bacterium]|nr:aminopeptidase P family protein [Anaerolineales bacterium]HRE47927.1 M24 family metallopeptidase [Aggregatilineales bacterium]